MASAAERNDCQASSAPRNKAREERTRSSCCDGNAPRASSNEYSAVSGGNSKSDTASREAAPHSTGSGRGAALDAPEASRNTVAGGGSGGGRVGAHGSGGQNAGKCGLLASPKCPVNGLAEGSEGRCLFCALPVGTAASRHAMGGLDPPSHALSSQQARKASCQRRSDDRRLMKSDNSIRIDFQTFAPRTIPGSLQAIASTPQSPPQSVSARNHPCRLAAKAASSQLPCTGPMVDTASGDGAPAIGLPAA